MTEKDIGVGVIGIGMGANMLFVNRDANSRFEVRGLCSPTISKLNALADKWQEIEARLKAGPPATIGNANRDAFLKEWEQTDASSGHIKAVNALSPSARKAGTAWLQEIVNSASTLWTKI